MFHMKVKAKDAFISGLQPVKNEDGSIIVIVLVLLALATVMGISGTTTTSTELQISGNDRIYKENFYLADGGIMECAQTIQDGSNMADASSANWLHKSADLPDSTDITDASNWDNANSQVSANVNSLSSIPTFRNASNTTRYLAVVGTVSGGTSLDISRSRVYQYQIYSRTVRDNGTIYLEAGYRKAS